MPPHHPQTEIMPNPSQTKLYNVASATAWDVFLLEVRLRLEGNRRGFRRLVGFLKLLGDETT